MINIEDQEQLLKLVADYLEKDVTCTAIGGTAMMFFGYKNTTKDIDLVFENEQDRLVFINAIEKLGYKQKSLSDVYDIKRQKHPSKPVMYSRGDERFDLFVKNVFGFMITIDDRSTLQRQEFIGKNELIMNLPSKELLILLKAITRRPKDHEDIETILDIEKLINWDNLIAEAIIQRKNKGWILYDLEETLQKLKGKYLIKQKYFDKIYSAEEEL